MPFKLENSMPTDLRDLTFKLLVWEVTESIMDQPIHPNVLQCIRKGIPLLVGGIPYAVSCIKNKVVPALPDRAIQFYPIEVYYEDTHDDRYLFSSYQIALITLHAPSFKVPSHCLIFLHLGVAYTTRANTLH
jgi:hypothetical protein